MTPDPVDPGMSSISAKTYCFVSANGEFGDPLDPPKSPPGPGPAQRDPTGAPRRPKGAQRRPMRNHSATKAAKGIPKKHNFTGPKGVSRHISISLACAVLERGHPHRAQAKPLLFEALFFDGGRSGIESDLSGPPRPRTEIKG